MELAEAQAKFKVYKHNWRLQPKTTEDSQAEPEFEVFSIRDFQRARSEEEIEEVGSEASGEDLSIVSCLLVEN